MSNNFLYLLELKSVKGGSIPLSNFRENQLNSLSKVDHKKIKTYFIINFRELEKTYAILADDLKTHIDSISKKSINNIWFKDNAILINQTKKRTRYYYNTDNLLL